VVQWPLAAALLLLVVELLVPEHGRARGAARPARHPHPTLAGTAGLSLLLALAGALFPLRAPASAGSAYRAFHDGDYTSAQAEYERLARESPEDARLRFNAGAAAYRARAFPRAAEHFTGALRSRDVALQQQAYYNLGNARYAEGDALPEPQARSQAWQQAIRSYESALKLRPDDPDARHNLDLVRRRLEELQQQQKQEQQQQQNSQGDDQDPQDQDNSSQDPSKQEQDPSSGKDASSPQDNQDRQQPQEGDADNQDPRDENQTQPKPQGGEQDPRGSEQPRGESGSSGDPSSKAGSEGPDREGQSGNAREGAAEEHQMTPQQALRLLDAARGEEKPISPPKGKGRARVIKDW